MSKDMVAFSMWDVSYESAVFFILCNFWMTAFLLTVIK